tara:strand:+ start:2036 stop:2680 length:645 start_codon:yes stop_codon:yes gene_type:complete
LDANGYPIITPTSGNWASYAEYRYRSDDSSYVYYDKWNTVSGAFQYLETENASNDGGYQIRVSKSTDTWSDYPHTGSHAPTGVSTTGSNVSLGSEFTFVKPSGTGQTPWSTGGTNTEGIATAVGSFYNVSATHFSYKVYHTGAFSSSQTYELHSTTLTPTFISDIVVGAGAQSINSRTHTWAIPDVVEIRDSLGSVLASLTLSHPNKKVFCNFW